MLKGGLCPAALASLFMSGAAFARQKIKVGVTATLEGTYTTLGEDGIRGFQTRLEQIRQTAETETSTRPFSTCSVGWSDAVPARRAG
jgi:hypothetical protein